MNQIKSRRILLTGGAGYIGSVALDRLLKNHELTVFDTLLHGVNVLTPFFSRPGFQFIKADIRDVEQVKKALGGIDTVIHLAAIVGDPACKKFKKDAESTNTEGSEILLSEAKSAGVKKFIFASTCSNYGVMKNAVGPLDENAELAPQSEYAKQKTGFEKYRNEHPSVGMKTVVLRFATAFGISPRMRFDLSVNHFSRDLALGKKLEISAAKTWRPYCHVQDISQAISLVVNRPDEMDISPVFNVGSSKENYSKEMLVNEILREIPNGKTDFLTDPGSDIRNYFVDFSRIRMELGFQNRFTVPDGIREVVRLVKSGLIQDPYSQEFQNA